MHVAEQIYGTNRCDILAYVALKMARAVLGTTSPCWGRGGVYLAGKAPPDPPLNGRSSHLIEAARRGRLDQMIFFFGAADDTRAADDRPAGHYFDVVPC